MTQQRPVVVLMLTVLVATTGYGVSFPLFAISLENMQVTSSLIGLNAAMPALGWIIASSLIPKFQARYSTSTLMIAFLAIAIVGLAGFTLSSNYTFWLLCRFLFGGGLGMFFRTVEYYLNSTAEKDKRGLMLGVYITLFLIGIIVGSSIQPIFGIDSLKPYGFIMACLAVSVICLFGAQIVRLPVIQPVPAPRGLTGTIKKLYVAVPIAAAGAFVYGLVESIPAYLMPIYALKSGLDEASAAYTLTAFAAGNVLLAIPLGLISDKVGRFPVIYGCMTVGAFCLLLVPFSITDMVLFYAILFIIGGCIVGLYSVCLSLIGDHFSASELISTNAAFGILYAVGLLIGPIMHGIAMQIYEPNGMIVSAALVFVLFLLFAAKSTGISNEGRS